MLQLLSMASCTWNATTFVNGKLYMECYNFCQQCKDHFDTAGAKGYKRVFFAALFLKNSILYRWQQYKARTKRS